MGQNHFYNSPTPPLNAKLEMQLRYEDQREAIRAAHEISTAAHKAQIASNKKDADDEKDIRKAERMSIARANVNMQKELLKTNVEIGTGGEVLIVRQIFGGNLKDEPPFRITSWVLCKNGVNDEAILVFSYELAGGRKDVLYIDANNLADRVLNTKFNSGGLRFGFSHAKESMLRLALVVKLIQTAQIRYLPIVHGWYKEEGKFKYCFPDEYTFEEVKKHV